MSSREALIDSLNPMQKRIVFTTTADLTVLVFP